MGRHPERDPWGKKFGFSYHPERARMANQQLAGGFKFILDGIQGDADFVSAMFQLNRSLNYQ